MNDPILPGATLGVLGGGQLGRMFALAARRLGYRVAVYSPDDDTPTGQVADIEMRGVYEHLERVESFAKSVSVVTFEFENIPSETAAAAARHAPLRPAGTLLHTTQQRAREKNALAKAGIPVARFAHVNTADDLDAAIHSIGAPAILKTAAWGYDGKGQVRIERAEDAATAWASIDQSEAVLEELVAFRKEISVVGARGLTGEIALYEPIENSHANHILDVSTAPASISNKTKQQATEIARTLLETWDVVGVMCVEMFVLDDGNVLVNEIAPRPHNSGHLTIDAHATSQFEQQVRAVCGIPLGSVQQRAPAAMANLLGDLWQEGEPAWTNALAMPSVALHLYGKEQARVGRKMGHLTGLGVTADEARDRVVAARESLTQRDP